MNKVAEKIIADVNTTGGISFARFMELALYCPEYGYYERIEDSIGRAGDFFTSVSVGSLFGELLAFQFCRWMDALGRAPSKPSLDVPLHIIEAGAHRGQLALDILGSIQKRRPELFAKLTYILIEPSETRKALQKSTLVAYNECLKWVSQVGDLNGIAEAKGFGCGLRGIFFCNELFDAMPVHVLKWDARQREWIEWGVTHSHDRFTWTELAPWPGPVHSMIGKLAPQKPEVSAGAIEDPHRLYEVLPNGFTTEVCPSASEFWTQACDVIEEGYLLMMDYGLIAEDFFAPQRSVGTLRSYKNHKLNADVLSNPGEQDLTAHVDFSAIADAGERASARTIAYTTQAQFLTNICAPVCADGGLKPEGWTPAQRRQFQTLTHPEHLGNAFRVLIQSRGHLEQFHTGSK